MNSTEDNIRRNYDNSKWDKAKDKFSYASSIARILKKVKNLGYVVRNFTKGYEIFSSYPLLVQSGKLNSIHIGDEHGGMLVALNHYLHSHFPDVHWNWRAICQNPYYEDGVNRNS